MTDTNAGDMNAGDMNTGRRNAGDMNAGNRNAGDMNAGNWNAGDMNAGDMNAGNWNAGHGNAGNMNAGNWNAGNWNSCDNETGYFNTDDSQTVRVFNAPCLRNTWDECDKPNLIYFNVTEWVPESVMTDQEKVDHATFHTTGGYLRKYEYKDAFQKSWDNADEDDRAKLLNLPNFDAAVFKEISGVDVKAKRHPATIVVDGVKYVKSDG